MRPARPRLGCWSFTVAARPSRDSAAMDANAWCRSVRRPCTPWACKSAQLLNASEKRDSKPDNRISAKRNGRSVVGAAAALAAEAGIRRGRLYLSACCHVASFPRHAPVRRTLHVGHLGMDSDSTERPLHPRLAPHARPRLPRRQQVLNDRNGISTDAANPVSTRPENRPLVVG